MTFKETAEEWARYRAFKKAMFVKNEHPRVAEAESMVDRCPFEGADVVADKDYGGAWLKMWHCSYNDDMFELTVLDHTGDPSVNLDCMVLLKWIMGDDDVEEVDRWTDRVPTSDEVMDAIRRTV